MSIDTDALGAELEADGFLSRKTVKALIDEVRYLRIKFDAITKDFRESRDETVDLVTERNSFRNRVALLEAALTKAPCQPAKTNCTNEDPCDTHRLLSGES